MATYLDRLNHLLKTSKLGLPSFRQEVTPSFANLHWLRSKVAPKAECPEELRELLQKDPKTLLKPISEGA